MQRLLEFKRQHPWWPPQSRVNVWCPPRWFPHVHVMHANAHANAHGRRNITFMMRQWVTRLTSVCQSQAPLVGRVKSHSLWQTLTSDSQYPQNPLLRRVLCSVLTQNMSCCPFSACFIPKTDALLGVLPQKSWQKLWFYYEHNAWSLWRNIA